MDIGYSQQQQARRKNRSAANLQHLTLAPLTPRLPLRDDYDGTNIIDNHSYFSNAAAHASTSAAAQARIPSYLQGRSAPATPRLLSKSPTASRTASRSHSHEGGRRGKDGKTLAKSMSTTQLHIDANHQHLRSNGTNGTGSNGTRNHRRRKTDNHHSHLSEGGEDWLFRAAVLVSSEARESKGQSWLTARASSTSLSGLRSAEEAEDVAAFERELAREREYLDRISGNSRRGSLDHDVTSPIASAHGHHSRTGSRFGSRAGSRIGSRANSRTHSRVGSRVQLFTPMDARRHSLDTTGEAGYFDYADVAEDDDEYRVNNVATPAGPDFVNLDEALEAIELHQRDTSLEDEDHIRRLVKREKAGGVMGSWLGNVFGWSLFSVQENEGEVDDDEDDEEEEEETEDDEEDDENDTTADETESASSTGKNGKAATSGRRRRSKKRRSAVAWNQRGTWAASRRRFEGDEGQASEEPVPPPPGANEGTWQDAAWLLSVASKVIL